LLSGRYIVAIAFSFPLLLVMAHKALRYNVNVNWTVPVYLSLLPAASQWLLGKARQERRGSRRRVWQSGLAWTLLLCGGLNGVVGIHLLAFEPHLRWTRVFGPWKPLAGIVQEHADRLQRETGREPLVVADGRYRLASSRQTSAEPSRLPSSTITISPCEPHAARAVAIRGTRRGRFSTSRKVGTMTETARAMQSAPLATVLGQAVDRVGPAGTRGQRYPRQAGGMGRRTAPRAGGSRVVCACPGPPR
jgi:hypothetical protein